MLVFRGVARFTEWKLPGKLTVFTCWNFTPLNEEGEIHHPNLPFLGGSSRSNLAIYRGLHKDGIYLPKSKMAYGHGFGEKKPLAKMACKACKLIQYIRRHLDMFSTVFSLVASDAANASRVTTLMHSCTALTSAWLAFIAVEKALL